MPDLDISTDYLEQSLQIYITPENEKRIKRNFILFKRILKKSPLMLVHVEQLLMEGILVLKSGDYWLKLEIEAKCLSDADDILLRRCLMNFVAIFIYEPLRPSRVKINSIDICCLAWFRKSRVLGNDVIRALFQWNNNSQLVPISRLSAAQNAMACLRRVCEDSKDIEKEIYSVGLEYFGDAAQYNLIFEDLDIGKRKKVLQQALLAVLAMYDPDKFKSHVIFLSGVQVDVTDLYYLSPICVQQLITISTSSYFSGEKEHCLESIVRRFKVTVYVIKLVFQRQSSEITTCTLGLDSFKFDSYRLLKSAKIQLSAMQFNDLVLLLGTHWGNPVLKHQYQVHLLPFFFEKLDNFTIFSAEIFSADGTK